MTMTFYKQEQTSPKYTKSVPLLNPTVDITYMYWSKNIFRKKTLACRDGAEKRTEQGRDYTIQKKTNIIQEEEPLHIFHTLNSTMEQM